MSQGDFTKEEAVETEQALDEIMKGMSKSKSIAFIGHFNDIFLFLKAAKENAPSEEDVK